MIYIGIDNGVSGAISIISNERVYTCWDMPVQKRLSYNKKAKFFNHVDFSCLMDLFGPYSGEPCIACIERPMINPKFFNASLSAAMAHKVVTLALERSEIAYRVIDSKEWQRQLLPKGKSKDLKKMALDVAKRLFPKIQNMTSGMADSLLIAENERRLRNATDK